MPYHHIAHLQSFEPGLAVGVKFRKGDLLGKVGKSGTKSPHCHYEIMIKKPQRWTQYIWGMTKDTVASKYIDPMKYIDTSENLPAPFNNKSGYGYLDPILKDSAIIGYHPGADINNDRAWDDLGNELRATTDGMLSFMGTDRSKLGWGNHLWWKEINADIDMYDNHLIQDTEDSGSFALVYKGKKHLVLPERAGLASLTVQSRAMPYRALTKKDWDTIPTGDNF